MNVVDYDFRDSPRGGAAAWCALINLAIILAALGYLGWQIMSAWGGG